MESQFNETRTAIHEDALSISLGKKSLKMKEPTLMKSAKWWTGLIEIVEQMEADACSLVRMGDRSAAKTTLMGGSDSFCFSDCEYIEGTPLIHQTTPMKKRSLLLPQL